MKYFSATKKELTDTGNIMADYQKHCAKWKKLDTNNYTLHDSIYSHAFRTDDFIIVWTS